jgi:arginine decarboxylase-like protein
VKNFQEVYHDLRAQRDHARMLFNTGQLGMRERARIEACFWYGLGKIRSVTSGLEYVPDEFASL